MLEGLVATIRRLRTHAEEGFLIGSIWKYLIYTELALAVEHDVNTRSPQLFATEDERNLIQFIQQNRGYFNEDFGSRMKFAIDMITASDEAVESASEVVKVSEVLHYQLLARLRDLLKAGTSEKQRVAIIVDNLDKNWHANADIDVLVEFLRGLIEVAERLQDELQTKPYGVKEPKYTLSIFLRSDIYATLRGNTSEKDKLNGDILDWNDSEQLGRLLDERLEYYAKVEDASTTWTNYFEAVGEVPARSFILSSVLPRPRDAIFLTNDALDKAKNRGHSIVTSSDICEAFDSYSNWAFDSLLAEDHPSYGKLESILYEFIGSDPRLAVQQVKAVLGSAGVPQDLQDYYLNLLLDTNFLGFVSLDGGRVFPSGEDRRRRQRRRHERLYEAKGIDMQYCIHPAFYPVLGI